MTTPPKTDPRQLTPHQLLVAINGTALGTVMTARELKRIREQAGLRIGDGKTVHLMKFMAWLALDRSERLRAQDKKKVEASDEPVGTYRDGTLVLNSPASLARFYQITIAAVRDRWLIHPDFPFVRSGPGKENWIFNVRDIDRWLVMRDAKQYDGRPSKAAAAARKRLEQYGIDVSGTAAGENVPSLPEALSHKDKRQEIEARRAELKFEKESGRLVDKELVISSARRHHAIARQCLAPIPDSVLSIMPADTAPEFREEIRRRVDEAIRNCLHSIAEVLVSDELL